MLVHSGNKIVSSGRSHKLQPMGKLITSVSTLHQYQPLVFSLIKFATIAPIITGTVSVDFSGTRALEFVRSSDPAARRLIRSMAPAHPARLAIRALARHRRRRHPCEAIYRRAGAEWVCWPFPPRRNATQPERQDCKKAPHPPTRSGGSFLGRATRRLHLPLPSR